MATKINYSHGDTGSQPADGHDFQGGNAADPQKFDWYIDTFVKRINELADDINNGNIDAATLDGSAGTNGEVLKSDGTGTFWGTANQYTDEDAQDAVGTIMGGSNGVTVTYDDANDTITIDGGGADTRTDVSDSGTTVVSETADINFDSNLQVTDDGDGTVTVDASSSTDTTTDVSESGTTVVNQTSDINFIGSSDAFVSVTDDGDGTATVDVDVTDTDTTYSAGNALSLSGTEFNVSESSISHDNLSNVSSGDHHSKYTDSEAVSAWENTSNNIYNDTGADLSLDGNITLFNGSDDWTWQIHNDGYMQFVSAASIYMTLDANGNVEIQGSLTENASL